MQYKQFEAGKSERAHGALRKSTMVDRHLVEFTCKLHNLSFKKKKKKKQPLVNRRIQEPYDTGRFPQEDTTGEPDRGEGGKRRANFTVFSIANKAAARSGCPISNPDPNNTIGLVKYLIL